MATLLGVWRQFCEVGLMALGGVAAGLLVDGLRVARGVLGVRAGLGVLLDVLFWVVTLPLAAAWLVIVNGGQLRLYVPLAVGVGLALYYAWFSPLAVPVLRWLARAVYWLGSWALVGLALVLGRLIRGLAFWREQGWVGGEAAGPVSSHSSSSLTSSSSPLPPRGQ